jgi:predicted nucleotidyltransferase
MAFLKGAKLLPDELLEQRRSAAQKIARSLSPLPEVASILVFGSVATKTVDQFSDVDILVLCEPNIISPQNRHLILEQVGSDWQINEPSGNPIFASLDEGGIVDTIPVTLHYQTFAWIDDVLREVCEQGAITTKLLPFRPYTLPALLQRGWLLIDKHHHVERWRSQTKVYPKPLKRNIVQHFKPILQGETEELLAAAQRGLGPRNFHFHLNRSVDALISILYALNELYDPADRRAAQTVWPVLTIAPANFVARLTVVLKGPFDQAGMKEQSQRYSSLVSDVMDLSRRQEL